MPTIRQAALERARAYVLDHPDESKVDQAIGAGVSTATIATVRAKLIKQGLLSPTRKLAPPRPDPTPPVAKPRGNRSPLLPKPEEPEKPIAPPRKSQELLDHEAMLALSALADEIEDLTDEEKLKRLQKQALLFAFNTRLHPDTRMSASQMWTKLRDQAKSKDLGPGEPLTFEEAVSRLSELMTACGPEITLAAVNAVYQVKEDTNGEETDSGTPDESPPSDAGTAGHENPVPET